MIEGNTKLQASTSVAEFAGPSLAGLLIQLLTAPLALVVDAFSFLVSAVALFSFRVQKTTKKTETRQQHFWQDLKEGLLFTFRSQILRAVVESTGTLNFTGGVFDALLVLYVTRSLHLGAAFFGVMYTIGSLSGIVAALLGTWIAQRFGTAKMAFVSALLIAIGWVCIPLASGSILVVISLIVIGMLIAGMGNTLFNIAAQTLVQTSTPDNLLGRVHSSQTFIGVGSLPVGALVGGILGNVLGLRPVLLAAAIVRFVLLALFLRPLWRQKE